MTVRISELNELSVDLSQADLLPVVDVSAAETKRLQIGSLIAAGISGAPSSFIDISKLNQSSATKLSSSVLANTGVSGGTYGSASVTPRFVVNSQGVITFASGITTILPANQITGLAPVATSGTYQSLTGLPTLGTIASQASSGVYITGGFILNTVITTNSAVITGGVISGITDLAIADGGTGASTASGARANLGLAIGANVQAYNSILDGIVTAAGAADRIFYTSASGVIASSAVSSFGRTFVSSVDASTARSTLGLGSIALQNAGGVTISGGSISNASISSNSVAITGGTINGITDLAIADGGTGASTASEARANLGLAIGTNVQAYSSVLDGINSAANNADRIFYTSASGVVAGSFATSFGRSLVASANDSAARSTLGLGSVALQNANAIAIGGGTISGITDLAVADGGTGASSAAGARANLGLVIGTNVQAYDAGLASIAGLTTGASQLIYTTASDAYATTAFPSFVRNLVASGSSAANIRQNLELGALATKGFISGIDVNPATISGSLLASGTITSREIGAGSVISAAIAAGNVVTASIADNAVTSAKLADQSSTVVAVGTPVGSGLFTGQQWLDTATNLEYTWDGATWRRQAAINTITISDSTPIDFAVTYPDLYSATITATLANQTANSIFAGPSSGTASTPSFRSLVSSDLPVATISNPGATMPGAGLSVDANGSISHSNSATAGTYTGAITIDAQGHIVSAQTNLQASDIPSLDASKITTGTFGSSFLAANSVTADQLADYGIAQVSESAPIPKFAGQWWVNPNDRAAYIWVGTVSPTVNGYWLNLGYGSPTQINLRFGGTYNASGNTVSSINSYGIEAGLTVGQPLSAPNTSNNGLYLICTASGVGTAPAPSEPISIGNWVLSQGVGATWTKVSLSSAVAGVADQDVLVSGPSLVPAASGIASQEDFNLSVWAKVQIANTVTAGITRASSEVVVASGTGSMSIGVIDDGTY